MSVGMMNLIYYTKRRPDSYFCTHDHREHNSTTSVNEDEATDETSDK